MYVQIKEGILLLDDGINFTQHFKPDRSYLVLAEVEHETETWPVRKVEVTKYYEVMDEVCGNIMNPKAAPNKVSREWFDVVDESRPNWVTRTFDYGGSDLWTYSGDARYVKAHEDWRFYERMAEGEFPDLALLRLIYPPSTWHSDAVGVDDSIPVWMKEYVLRRKLPYVWPDEI